METNVAKHAGGRPTKLNDELIAAAEAYVNECKDTVEHHETESGKSWQTVTVKMPTIEGLARRLRVSRDIVYDWEKGDSELHKQFSYILNDLRAEQADRLINNGLSGTYNPTIAKVLLTKHGYVEKQEQQVSADVTSKGEALPNTGADYLASVLDKIKADTAAAADK